MVQDLTPRPYLCDQCAFCVMSGGLTRDEKTMIPGVQQDTLRDDRLQLPSPPSRVASPGSGWCRLS